MSEDSSLSIVLRNIKGEEKYEYEGGGIKRRHLSFPESFVGCSTNIVYGGFCGLLFMLNILLIVLALYVPY